RKLATIWPTIPRTPPGSAQYCRCGLGSSPRTNNRAVCATPAQIQIAMSFFIGTALFRRRQSEPISVRIVAPKGEKGSRNHEQSSLGRDACDLRDIGGCGTDLSILWAVRLRSLWAGLFPARNL